MSSFRFTDLHFPGCWIGNNYKAEKIVFEYLWMWLAAFIMLCLYGVIALVLRGVLVIGDEQNDERRWTVGWNWQLRRVGSSSRKRDLIGSKDEAVGPDDSDEERRQAKVIANRMLLYVFPHSIQRERILTFLKFLVIQRSTYSACFPSQLLAGWHSVATQSIQLPLS